MARTEITFQLPVSIFFDSVVTTAAESVNDFFRALAEAAGAGFLARSLIDISYGRPDQWTAAPAANSSGRPGAAGTPCPAALAAAAAALPPGALDDLVHDVASDQASNINNDGPASQAAFLARTLGPGAALTAVTGLGETGADGGPR